MIFQYLFRAARGKWQATSRYKLEACSLKPRKKNPTPNFNTKTL